MSFAAIYDACVLYPFEVRDILMVCAYTRLFAVHWTDEILNECTRNLIEDKKATLNNMSRMVAGMKSQFPDATIPKKTYEHLVSTMTCAAKDRHVLAAAVGRADVIVTYNVKDFPASSVDKYKIKVLTPDKFVCNILMLNPEKFFRWYFINCDERAKRAKLRGFAPVTPQALAKFFKNGPLPDTGQRILELLKS
jgi:predicted nucleic acid-binding protein